MKKILVADPIAQDGIDILKSEAQIDVRPGMSPDELKGAINGYHALVVRSETRVTADIFEAGKQLEAVGRAGVGVDNIDLEAATARGVIVVNAPLGNTISAAEHTIGLMLALARHIAPADASLRGGEWKRAQFAGVEVREKTLGVVGLGNVGSEVARRGKGLDMNVVAYDPFVSPERAQMLGVELADSLDDVIRRADFLTLHSKLTAETRNQLGARELAMMKRSARIINAGRGELIDLDALVQALDSEQIAGAAIDVFPDEPKGEARRDATPFWSHPVLKHPKVIVTPHLGASTAEAQERVAIDVARQILAILRGEPAQYAVNAPMVSAETMKVLAPYMPVATKVAALATQLSHGQLGNIEIEYLGDIASHDTAPLKAAVIKGLLEPITEENVTIVNAGLIAENRGMRIVERKGPAENVYNNLVRVHLHTSGGDTDVTGTVGHKGPAIVEINDVWIDIPVRKGWLLLIDNHDRPGTVGALGMLLGKHGINITSMEVESIEGKDQALMALTVDQAIEPAALSEITAIDNIIAARVARFL
jgi:D-3-phosphoglycerate dehydrogenase